MSRRRRRTESPRRPSLLLVASAVFVFVATAGAAVGIEPGIEIQVPPDSVLQERVVTALSEASDVPARNLAVAVEEGLVIVSLAADSLCHEHPCPGRNSPGGEGTVQQSIGVVVRAVPGVREVRFFLGLDPDSVPD